MIRADFIFSNWIFLYYLFYLKINNPSYPTPKFLLICGLMHNVLSLSLITLLNKNSRIKYYYLIMMFFGKILPLYTVYNTTTDINFSLYLLVFYSCWLIINKQHPYRFFTDSKNVIYSDKIILPSMNILDKYFYSV